MIPQFPIDSIRAKFPALSREVKNKPVAFFDGPAGSQVPQSVADAVSAYLLHCNANRGGVFATAKESDDLLETAHLVLAAFLGVKDPQTVIFGANMTSLTFALSRSVMKTWKPGDEIIVSDLDHDANVTPWVLAAEQAGAKVLRIPIQSERGTLDYTAFENSLSERTVFLAIGAASNITGTVNPVKQMIEKAHQCGAHVFVDAVHYAPHRLIDVEEWNCDFLSVSSYKFFGTHVGILVGKQLHLEQLQPAKLRPAPNSLPGRWMTGTQNHEGIVGAAQAVRYLASISEISSETPTGSSFGLRDRLQESFKLIRAYEEQLLKELLKGLKQLSQFTIWGLQNEERFQDRVPTVSVTHNRKSPRQMAEILGEQGLFLWHGNHYAFPFTSAAGLEPEGTLRIGLLHYNTLKEVRRLLNALAELD